MPFLDVGAGYRELAPELDAAYHRVMDGGWYILGDEVEAFEREFATYCGVRHCVGVGNGLDALHLLLRASGIGDGHEVIVPSNTFIATWLAVSQAGAAPVPVEPDPATYAIDPDRVAAAVTPRTRAILAVHLYGRPADMGRLREVAARHGLRLFEDAAQAHGARTGGRTAGALGDGAAFSFYPGKNLGAYGDAGAVTTDDDDLARQVRLLRNYGSCVKYVHDVRGLNSRLDPVHAAMLAVKLRALDDWNARRRQTAALYMRRLAGIDELTLPDAAALDESAWHVFVVRHPRRNALADVLAGAGIETLVHYPVPPHLSGAYRDRGWAAGDFPIAEHLAATVLSLPIGPQMAAADAGLVADGVAAAAAGL